MTIDPGRSSPHWMAPSAEREARRALETGEVQAVPAPIPATVRKALPDDRRFIVETTAKVRLPRGVPWTDWARVGLRDAEQALETGEALVLDAGGVLLGFLLAHPPIVEMLYVKREFRGFGFGLDLLQAADLLSLGWGLRARAPTPCWRRWCSYHHLDWRAA